MSEKISLDSSELCSKIVFLLSPRFFFRLNSLTVYLILTLFADY